MDFAAQFRTEGLVQPGTGGAGAHSSGALHRHRCLGRAAVHDLHTGAVQHARSGSGGRDFPPVPNVPVRKPDDRVVKLDPVVKEVIASLPLWDPVAKATSVHRSPGLDQWNHLSICRPCGRQTHFLRRVALLSAFLDV